MANPVVRGLSCAASQGKLDLGFTLLPCAVGRAGIGIKRGEGDGVTPLGRWPVRHVFYRADRIVRPSTALPVTLIRPDMGWCDAPGDSNYNRLVRLPYPSSHECLWREDHLYDLLAVLGYNDRPRIQGRGSAIFLHLARPDYRSTEGCVAFALPHLRRLLKTIKPGGNITIA